MTIARAALRRHRVAAGLAMLGAVAMVWPLQAAQAQGLAARAGSAVTGTPGQVMGIGLAFMDEFNHRDRCLTGGEAAVDAAARSGAALGVLGAVAGGVAGLAMGGNVGSAGKGAVIGAAGAGLVGAAGANRGVAQLAAGERDIIRRRSIDLCQLAQTALQLGVPVWENLASVLGPACGIAPERLFRGDGGLDRLALSCARRDPRLFDVTREHVHTVRMINIGACRSAAYRVAEYDRQLLAIAVRSAGSAMPTVTPDCNGDYISSEMPWLLR